MAQAIGGAVIAAFVYLVSLMQFAMFGHRFAFGCAVLGFIVWLSTESLLGGIAITALAVGGILTGHLTVFLIACVAAIWSFVAWGLGK